MDNEHIKMLISKGENIEIEFKEAANEVPNSMWETVCSMLNTKGGEILLGVDDNANITGVNPKCVDSMIKNIVNKSNDPTIIDPPLLLNPEKFLIDDKPIIYIYIPSSSQVHRYKKVFYDRLSDGDFKISNHNSIEDLYRRKSLLASESTIYPYLKYDDFNQNVFIKIKELLKSNNPTHPWMTMDNEHILRSALLYRRDYKTGKEGYTLAAALLFGKDDVIRNILPAYNIDVMVRKKNIDRYDDRVIIETNLIDAYSLLIKFVEDNIPSPFFLENGIRIDLRSIIFREVVANILVHREYFNSNPCTFIIYNDRVETHNANIPNGYGVLDPNAFSPFYKNPIISSFFNTIGLVEKIGSGVRNVTKYIESFAGEGRTAQFIEDNIFKMIIPIPYTEVIEGVAKGVAKGDNIRLIDGVSQKAGRDSKIYADYMQYRNYIFSIINDAYVNVSSVDDRINIPSKNIIATVIRIVEYIALQNGVSKKEILDFTGYKGNSSIDRIVKVLTMGKIVKATGGTKNRIYEVNEPIKRHIVEAFAKAYE